MFSRSAATRYLPSVCDSHHSLNWLTRLDSALTAATQFRKESNMCLAVPGKIISIC